jgi:VWFA-related protein
VSIRPLRYLLLFVIAALLPGPKAPGRSSPWRSPQGHARGIVAKCAAAFPPQEAGVDPAGADRTAPRGGREMVKFAFTVRDKKNRLVLDLAKEELRVFEDRTEQRIEYFSPELTLPLNLGLLIDLSRSQRGRMRAAAGQAMEAFFRRVLRTGDQALVIGFQDKAYLVSDFADSPASLAQAIQKASEIGLDGGTRLYDTIEETCRLKLASKPGRKTLVIITDGEDNSSRMTRDEAAQAATHAGAVIYVICTPQPTAVGSLARGTAVSRYISEQSGGRAYTIVVEKDFADAFNEIAEDLVNQYTVGYYSANPPRPDSVRKLRIESTRKGLRFFGPRSYVPPKG